MSDTVLEARGVTKTFPGPVTALDDVSLAVPRGRTAVLIGESGCGKTTLLRLFNRLESPTQGTIHVGGTDVATREPVGLRRKIGYVQQEGGLLPHWTIARNVELVPSLLGWSGERRRERSDELLSLVGLDPSAYRHRFPIELSGGQRQRVAFARALAADPDVILLDEPFGALDAITRIELQEEFLRLKRELGKTMLLVTHDLAEAFRLADLVAVMRSGRILQADAPRTILRSPDDDYVAELIAHGRSNVFTGEA